MPGRFVRGGDGVTRAAHPVPSCLENDAVFGNLGFQNFAFLGLCNAKEASFENMPRKQSPAVLMGERLNGFKMERLRCCKIGREIEGLRLLSR